MITMNTPCILKGNQVQFTVFRLTDVTLCAIIAVICRSFENEDRSTKHPNLENEAP